MLSSKSTLFSQHTKLKQEQDVLQALDIDTIKNKSIAFVNLNHGKESFKQWQLFCDHLQQFDGEKSEKLMLLQTAFQCLTNPIESGELAQFMTLASYLKSVNGIRLLQCLFNAEVPLKERKIKNYLTAMQLLIDLHDQSGIVDCVKKALPKLSKLIVALQEKQTAHLAEIYPINDIDTTIARLMEKNESVHFNKLKEIYQWINNHLDSLKTATDLKAEVAKHVRNDEFWKIIFPSLFAVIIEAMRRQYKVMPYDIQLLSVLSMICLPGELKGRIAQIQTGEGKSIIIAMLAAYHACSGKFVDIITSSSYLAIRDCKKYRPFFEALGLTVSHISDPHPIQSHFRGQILYGTNADFEFAMLRDGLYHTELRYSIRNGELQERTFDTVLVDEADNLFIDTALSSARIAVPRHEDISWVYDPILTFIKQSSDVTVAKLREYLLKEIEEEHDDTIRACPDRRLTNWLKSAKTAWYDKKENHHYIVKEGDIVIVDYANTGRLLEGCQWQHGLHQFLQAKHQLKVTSESLTAASISHPTYFNLYQNILGLTGTLGEKVEREEVHQIYGVDSVDVPPHFPSQRTKLPPSILPDNNKQYEKIIANIREMKMAGRPVLILFKTVKKSRKFSEYLFSKNMPHQLINETQREAEDYLIARAGFPSMITAATNTAGRGTDILLAPESKQAGGLHMIFTFCPNNSRVECQGFGRAGRQGQPGSCCMILSQQDEYLQQLLKKYNLQPRDHYFEDIKLFDDLRSLAIKEESEHRYQCSQREAIYFAKLQDFFDNLKKLHQLLKDNIFKKIFLDECQTLRPFEIKLNFKLNAQDKHWSSLLQAARILLKKQHEGGALDWSSFYDQFMDAYMTHVQHEWALFYSKCQDEINEGDIEIIREQVDSAYTEVASVLDCYLSNPQENVISCLHEILHMAAQDLSAEMMIREIEYPKFSGRGYVMS